MVADEMRTSMAQSEWDYRSHNEDKAESVLGKRLWRQEW